MNRTNFKLPFKAGCVLAALGLVMTVVAIATPEWTKTSDVTIGLWSLTDANGNSYFWTDTGAYEGKQIK